MRTVRHQIINRIRMIRQVTRQIMTKMMRILLIIVEAIQFQAVQVTLQMRALAQAAVPVREPAQAQAAEAEQVQKPDQEASRVLRAAQVQAEEADPDLKVVQEAVQRLALVVPAVKAEWVAEQVLKAEAAMV